MDKRQAIPEGIVPHADVTLEGVLQKQPAAVFAEIRREEIARAVLEINEKDIPLVAFGDTAKALADVATGSAVRLHGVLLVRDWLTGDRTPHVQIEVKVNSVEVLDDRRRRRVA